MTRHVTISIPLQWAILPLIVFILELIGARFLGVLYTVSFLSIWVIRNGVSFLKILRLRKKFSGTTKTTKTTRSLSFMDRMSDVEKELLKKQISKLENYIIRDFIDSWSVHVSPYYHEIGDEVQKLTTRMPSNYERILEKLELIQLLETLLQIITHHIYTFRAIFEQQHRMWTQSGVSQIYGMFEPLHYVSKEGDRVNQFHIEDWLHLLFSEGAIGNTELQSFISSESGYRILLCILAKHLVTLINHISDPDTINQLLVKAFQQRNHPPVPSPATSALTGDQKNPDVPRIRLQRDKMILPLDDPGLLSDGSGGEESDDEEVSPSISSILIPESSSPTAMNDIRERGQSVPLNASEQSAGQLRSKMQKSLGWVATKLSNNGRKRQILQRALTVHEKTGGKLSERASYLKKKFGRRRSSLPAGTLSETQLQRHAAINNDSDEPTNIETSSSDEEDCPNMGMSIREESDEGDSCLQGPDSNENDENDQSETSSVMDEKDATSEHGDNSTTSDLESLSEQPESDYYFVLSEQVLTQDWVLPDTPIFDISIPRCKIRFRASEVIPRRKQYIVYEVNFDVIKSTHGLLDKPGTSMRPVVKMQVSRDQLQHGKEAKIHSSRLVYKRFRDFLILHSALCDDPRMAFYVSQITTPHFLVLPYTPYSKRILEHRRLVLERYLQHLASSNLVCESTPFLDFLGLSRCCSDCSSSEAGSESSTSRKKVSVPKTKCFPGNSGPLSNAGPRKTQHYHSRSSNTDSLPSLSKEDPTMLGRFFTTAKDFSSLIMPKRGLAKQYSSPEMCVLSQNLNGLNYLYNGEIPSEVNSCLNPENEEIFSRPSHTCSNSLTQNSANKNKIMECFSSLESSHNDVIEQKQHVTAETSLGDCVIHFVQVVFIFFPYTLMNFQFLEEVFQTFLMPEVETLLKNLQEKFFSTRGATQLVGVIIDLLWPDSKLIVLESSERQLEEKIRTEKEAISCLAGFIEKKAIFINSQQAFKTSAEIISSFRDQEINKHLIFCFIDSIVLKLFGSKTETKYYH